MKQSKRPFLFAFLALMLALSPPVFAQAQDAFLFTENSGMHTSVAILDGTLYAVTSQGLYAYTPADGTTTKQLDSDVLRKCGLSSDVLLFAGEQLMLFDREERMIWRYDDQNLILQLDLSGSPFDDPTVSYSNPVCIRGVLFLLARDKNAYTHESRLIRLDLEDADVQVLSVQGITQLGLYKEDDLLALRQVNRPGAFYEIITIDAQALRTGETLATLPGFADGGAAFDPETDTLYAFTGGSLCAWNGEYWESVRIIPAEDFSFYYGVTGGKYVRSGRQGVGLYDMNAPEDQVTLRIQSSMLNIQNHIFDFMQANPQIAVSTSVVNHVCAEEIHTAVQTGDDSIDIYLVRLSTGVRKLMKKGYLEPLSGSEILTQDRQSLHSVFSDALTYEGKLYAVADSLSIWGWAMRPDILSEIAPPETLQALFDQIDARAGLPQGEDLPWITCAYNPNPWGPRDAVYYIYDQYAMARYNPTQPLSFADEGLKGLLESARTKLEQVGSWSDLSDLSIPGAIATDSYISPSGHAYESARMITSPVILPEEKPHILTQLYVYVINPLSRNKEAALTYLDYVAQNRPVSTQSMIEAGWTKEVFDFKGIRQSEEMLADMEQQLGTATGEERLELEAYKAALEEHVDAAYASTENWLVYEPALQCYKSDILPYLDLGLNPFIEDSGVSHAAVSGNIDDLLEQYISGSLSVDALIEKLDAIAERMYAEEAGLSS